MNDVTQILDRVHSGDPLAAGQLLPLVYQELRRIAGFWTAVAELAQRDIQPDSGEGLAATISHGASGDTAFERTIISGTTEIFRACQSGVALRFPPQSKMICHKTTQRTQRGIFSLCSLCSFVASSFPRLAGIGFDP